VARGTQHRKRRPAANARVAAAPARAQSAKRVKHARWEDQLFFSRLRVHAKWAFLLLAVVFAVGFVIFGVGSGSTGISDALQNFFSRSSSGTSAASLQKKALAHPNRPQPWRDLATKLEADNKLPQAIDALKRYSTLAPKDQSALEELASLYLRDAQNEQQAYIAAQTKSSILAPTPATPPSSSPLGKALSSLSNPIDAAVSAVVGTQSSGAYEKIISDETQAVSTYKKIAKLAPQDATTQFRLAQIAQGAGDTTTAVAAYKRFLKLAPNDPLAASAKKALKQLEPSKSKKSTATSSAKHK